MPNEPIERLSYSIAELRAATGMSRNRLYNAIAAGDLRTFKTGKRRFVTATAAREFITLLERRGGDG